MITAATLAFVIGTGLVIVGAVIVVGIYNRLVKLHQRMLNAFSQIDVQLKRRHDLVPNLVESVKGYMAHERQTLNSVLAARKSAVAVLAQTRPDSAAGVATLAGAETALMGALGQLLVLKEAYPQLKADQNVSQLMEQLGSTENRVAFARQAYNDAVALYNTARQTFPNVLFAGLFGFAAATLFQIDDAAERELVSVRLS